MSSRCPICRADVSLSNPHRPFCSPRCQDLDLGRWLNEEYKISRPMNIDEFEGTADESESFEDSQATSRILH